MFCPRAHLSLIHIEMCIRDRLESEAQWQAIQEVLLSKLAADLPACSGEVINTALDWLHDSNAVSRATLLMTLAERMENSHPQKQLLARAERILKREIQDRLSLIHI